jgi:ATP-binding cassette subfamily C protein LapB
MLNPSATVSKDQPSSKSKDGTTGDKSAIKAPAGRKGHWFWQYVLQNRRTYYQVIIASVMINLFALASSLYIMTVYDRVIPNNATESLFALTLIVIIIMGFDFTLKIIRGSFVDHAGTEIDKQVSSDLFDKISRHDISMSRQATGALANTVRDFEILKEVIGSASFAVFADLPFVILFLFVLYAIGGPVAAVPALVVPVVILFGLLLQPIMRKISDVSATQGQSKQAVMVELLSNLHTVKSVRGITILRNRWFQGVINQGSAQRRSRFTSQLATYFTQLGQQASQVGIIVYGVFLIASGNLTMGQLIACVILSGRTLAPLGQITSLLGRLNQAIVAYSGLSKVINITTEEEERTGHVRREKLNGGISLKNVSLTYEGQNEPSLNGCSFTVKPGEKVAILGRIGSGKSSLLSLMAGINSASAGAVLLDDADIRNLHPEDVRKNVSVVLQNPILFSGTVRENLLMGAPDASDEELVAAAELVGAGQFIGMLPNGFDFILSERGQELSAGMRQSLAIARAMIGNPNIILMDEPTSSMDATTENQLVQNLNEALRGKTAIFVTHRGPLVSIADRILIVDSGRIVMDGPRDEVLEKLKGGN